MNTPEIIFKEDEANIDWEECTKEIIAKFYESAGHARPSDWLDVPFGGGSREVTTMELDKD